MLERRRFLSLSAGAVASGTLASTLARPARAADWPDKPVKFILPYAPGGATDLVARPWVEKLSSAFNQQFVLEHRGGAAGIIGAEAASKSAPDGYTYLLTPNAVMTVLPSLRPVPYDPIKSFAPVARVGDLVCGFTIHPSVGVKTFKDFVDYVKKNPGKIAYGSAGLGSSAHLRIETLKYRAGLDILHVPYRGSADALNDLLAGNVQLMNEINVIPHVKAGKLILLDINYPTRHPDFPDVPTLTEAGLPNADVPIWYTLYAPAGTPTEIIAQLNAKVVEIARTDDMKAKMRAINVDVPIQTPEQISAFIAEDTARNAEVIKAANVKLE